MLLPDGRTQTVTYSVQDGYSGYSADVQYSGEAYDHASYKPVVSAYKPEPYKPAPYKPEPKYDEPLFRTHVKNVRKSKA